MTLFLRFQQSDCTSRRGLEASAREESSMRVKRPEHDKRLGVLLGILWGLAISVLLWALIRWALGAAITVLAGL